MSKFNIIVADPPYSFSDKLTMSSVKRGSASQYNTLSIDDLKSLNVPDICEDNALLALWCPSSLLPDGLNIMKSWGFVQKQTHVWVKTKQEPFKALLSSIFKSFVNELIDIDADTFRDIVSRFLKVFDLNSVLAFGLGRLFRQSHEIVLIGTKGKIYNKLNNKAQRSVHFYPATKHSTKPELLQDMLEIMFSGSDIKKLEMFARRERPGWTCLGNEVGLREDIRVSLEKLINENIIT
jgi:N6-adenosine-specific RNA methylase IME4